jgi:ABC-2 type transport system permease protein
VLAISGEYGTGMIRVTFTAVPRRIAVLTAKAAILAGLTGAAGLAAVGLSLLAGRLILPSHGISPAHGYPALSLADGAVLRAALGSVLYLMLIALLSLGVATCVRDSAAGIGIVLALLYLFPILGPLLGPDLGRHAQQIGPMTAAWPSRSPSTCTHCPSLGGQASAYWPRGPPRPCWPRPCCCACATPDPSRHQK